MTIVDASIATAWFVPIATSSAAERVKERPLLVAPALLRVELVSSLLKYVRVGLLPAEHLLPASRQIGQLVESWVPDEALLPAATGVALKHNHKIYDCLYLALALERRQPLATADRRLAALAHKLAIETELIEPLL